MAVKIFLLIVIGLSAGMIVSAGVFALITSTGLMSRMAGKTHTGKYVRVYETAVIIGGTWWNIFWVGSVQFNLSGIIHNIFLGVMGICQGMFIGCLAVSLAEAMNATAIFARRAKLKAGLSFIILSATVGKMIGSLVQFANDWVK